MERNEKKSAYYAYYYGNRQIKKVVNQIKFRHLSERSVKRSILNWSFIIVTFVCLHVFIDVTSIYGYLHLLNVC